MSEEALAYWGLLRHGKYIARSGINWIIWSYEWQDWLVPLTQRIVVYIYIYVFIYICIYIKPLSFVLEALINRVIYIYIHIYIYIYTTYMYVNSSHLNRNEPPLSRHPVFMCTVRFWQYTVTFTFSLVFVIKTQCVYCEVSHPDEVFFTSARLLVICAVKKVELSRVFIPVRPFSACQRHSTDPPYSSSPAC